MKAEESRMLPCSTSAAVVCVGRLRFLPFYVSMNHCETTASIVFGVTNKFYWVGELKNTEPMNDEGQLYITDTMLNFVITVF